MTSRSLIGLTGLLLALAGPGAVLSAPPAGTPAADPARFFETAIRPILQTHCVNCHGGEKPQGNLRLTNREGVLKGGSTGPSVSAKKPGESLLLAAVNYKGRRMPPKGKLGQADIDALTQWVKMGVPWSADHASLEPRQAGPPKVTAETMKWWSFQPVRRPPVPQVSRKEWVREPIDAFVLKRLEDAGLAPNPPASKAALIRRAYYDLTGLPPSREDVEAFLADASPKAWEKVVDRLLESPRYGEKWGRHWLDLVRYAESNSYERDGTKPQIWRFRDYVIRSFNADKPFDQFVTEQIAGDELSPRTPERLIATGYYRLGIWDDEPVDPQQALYDDLDDIVSTTGQVLLGMTVGCARCHDHKIDPVPQKDYYRFLAFFNGVRRYGVRSDESVAAASLRSLVPEEQARRQQRETGEYQAKLRAVQGRIDGAERPVLRDLTSVEREEWRTEMYRPPILKRRIGKLLTQEQYDAYVADVDVRRGLRESAPPALEMALCVTEQGKEARETYVLLRGNPHVRGDRVEPGFPSVLAPPEPEIAAPESGESSGRRLALAKWLSGAQNPLTARVLANRMWQYHFGRGIVRSANNFGFQGDKPTHPELLDWLASELTANGWRLKPLHKRVLMSAAYRMSSRANPVALAKDPENDLLWRFDMRRLQAEEMRDSILAANGSLNLKMGGPSIFTTIPDAVLAGQSMPGAGWGRSSPEEQCRRSVYIHVKRSLAVPILAAFDGPETDFTCPARFATTQPTQALGMLNSDFANEQARVFAKFLQGQAGANPAEQVKLGLWRVLHRSPIAAEVARGVRLIESLRRDESASAEEALTGFCLVALNLNEFLYLD